MEKLILSFFKEIELYDEDYFNLLKKNTTILHGKYEDIIDFIGVYYINDGKFKLYLPEIKTSKDLLIHVHEYGHALFKEDNEEIFPNILEYLFILKNPELFDIKKELKNIKKELKNSASIKHDIGKKVKYNLLKEKG